MPNIETWDREIKKSKEREKGWTKQYKGWAYRQKQAKAATV